MAKIFKISGYFVDPNSDYTADDLRGAFENNIDIFSKYLNIEERDIGEWEDDNPLNYINCPKSECEVYFKE